MSDAGFESDSAWAAAVEARVEHMEHGAYHLLCTDVVERRRVVYHEALEYFRRAAERLRRATQELNEATDLLEDSCRLMAMSRP